MSLRWLINISQQYLIILLRNILGKDGKNFTCKCKAKGGIEEECGEKAVLQEESLVHLQEHLI